MRDKILFRAGSESMVDAVDALQFSEASDQYDLGHWLSRTLTLSSASSLLTSQQPAQPTADTMTPHVLPSSAPRLRRRIAPISMAPTSPARVVQPTQTATPDIYMYFSFTDNDRRKNDSFIAIVTLTNRAAFPNFQQVIEDSLGSYEWKFIAPEEESLKVKLMFNAVSNLDWEKFEKSLINRIEVLLDITYIDTVRSEGMLTWCFRKLESGSSNHATPTATKTRTPSAPARAQQGSSMEPLHTGLRQEMYGWKDGGRRQWVNEHRKKVCGDLNLPGTEDKQWSVPFGEKIDAVFIELAEGKLSVPVLQMLTSKTSQVKLFSQVSIVATDNDIGEIKWGAGMISQMRILDADMTGICPLTYYHIPKWLKYEISEVGRLRCVRENLSFVTAHRVTLLFVGSEMPENPPLCYLIDPNGYTNREGWRLFESIENLLKMAYSTISLRVLTNPVFNTVPEGAKKIIIRDYALPFVSTNGWCLNYGLIFMMELFCTAGSRYSENHLTDFIHYNLLLRDQPDWTPMDDEENVLVLLYSYALAFALLKNLNEFAAGEEADAEERISSAADKVAKAKTKKREATGTQQVAAEQEMAAEAEAFMAAVEARRARDIKTYTAELLEEIPTQNVRRGEILKHQTYKLEVTLD